MKSLASRRRATYSLVICLSGVFWMACAASIDQIRIPSGVSVSVAEHEVIGMNCRGRVEVFKVLTWW